MLFFMGKKYLSHFIRSYKQQFKNADCYRSLLGIRRVHGRCLRMYFGLFGVCRVFCQVYVSWDYRCSPSLPTSLIQFMQNFTRTLLADFIFSNICTILRQLTGVHNDKRYVHFYAILNCRASNITWYIYEQF